MDGQALPEDLGGGSVAQSFTIVGRGSVQKKNMGVGADKERLEYSNGEQ